MSEQLFEEVIIDNYLLNRELQNFFPYNLTDIIKFLIPDSVRVVFERSEGTAFNRFLCDDLKQAIPIIIDELYNNDTNDPNTSRADWLKSILGTAFRRGWTEVWILNNFESSRFLIDDLHAIFNNRRIHSEQDFTQQMIIICHNLLQDGLEDLIGFGIPEIQAWSRRELRSSFGLLSREQIDAMYLAISDALCGIIH